MHRLFSDQQDGRWRFYSDAKIIAASHLDEACACLERILNDCGACKIAVLTDQNVRQTSFFSELVSSFETEIIELGSESDVLPMLRAIEVCREQGIDALIAVGGGSVMDSAKVIAAAVHNDMDLFELASVHELKHRKLPLVCVPTTFGTGSEVNMYGHIRDENRKTGIRRAWLTPDYALLVGAAGVSLPKFQRYLTGLDAWTHVYETLINARENNPFSIALLKDALKRHRANFRMFIESPTEENALEMATVSTAAGLAINNGRTGIMHTLAVPFAARTGLPHAESLLPFIKSSIEYNWKAVSHHFEEEMEQFLQCLEEQLLFNANDVVNNWNISLNSKDIEWMAKEALKDTVLFKENPTPMVEADILTLYQLSLKQFMSNGD